MIISKKRSNSKYIDHPRGLSLVSRASRSVVSILRDGRRFADDMSAKHGIPSDPKRRLLLADHLEMYAQNIDKDLADARKTHAKLDFILCCLLYERDHGILAKRHQRIRSNESATRVNPKPLYDAEEPPEIEEMLYDVSPELFRAIKHPTCTWNEAHAYIRNDEDFRLVANNSQTVEGGVYGMLAKPAGWRNPDLNENVRERLFVGLNTMMDDYGRLVLPEYGRQRLAGIFRDSSFTKEVTIDDLVKSRCYRMSFIITEDEVDDDRFHLNDYLKLVDRELQVVDMTSANASSTSTKKKKTDLKLLVLTDTTRRVVDLGKDRGVEAFDFEKYGQYYVPGVLHVIDNAFRCIRVRTLLMAYKAIFGVHKVAVRDGNLRVVDE
jgi:hypothetical protein